MWNLYVYFLCNWDEIYFYELFVILNLFSFCVVFFFFIVFLYFLVSWRVFLNLRNVLVGFCLCSNCFLDFKNCSNFFFFRFIGFVVVILEWFVIGVYFKLGVYDFICVCFFRFRLICWSWVLMLYNLFFFCCVIIFVWVIFFKFSRRYENLMVCWFLKKNWLIL